jgi:DNA-directed RNA polymerase subunit N (RpoN/RPB10)
MIIPVRCQSCGKMLADKWEAYNKAVDRERSNGNGNNNDVDADPATDVDGFTPKGKALNDLDIKRMCCRATFLSHVDMLANI